MVEAGGTNVIESYPCTICGCTCDDIRLRVENGRVIAAENACPVGVAGLTADSLQSNVEAWIDGQSATLAAAIDRTAGILRSAKSPLVYAGVDSTIESQRLAVQIAQRARGVLDSPAFAASAIFPDVGMVTCSLGEAKNRADLVVLWNCDPTVTHPRLLSHYLLDPPGYFRPKGRSDRTLVIVGNAQLANGIQPDDAVQFPHEDDFEQLWQLRSVVRRELVDNVI
jgi:formylmethanofuran dehydrogenase subunit B